MTIYRGCDTVNQGRTIASEEALQEAVDAAEAWAQHPFNVPVPTWAGANGIDDYSALHWATVSEQDTPDNIIDVQRANGSLTPDEGVRVLNFVRDNGAGYNYERAFLDFQFANTTNYDTYGNFNWIDKNGFYRQVIEGSVQDSVDGTGYLRLALKNSTGADSTDLTISESNGVEISAPVFTTLTLDGGGFDTTFNIGKNRTSDASGVIQFFADTSGSQTARIIRNTGASGSFAIEQYGAGNLELIPITAGIDFYSASLLRGSVGTLGGLVWGAPTGGDKGVGIINAKGFEIDGVAVGGGDPHFVAEGTPTTAPLALGTDSIAVGDGAYVESTAGAGVSMGVNAYIDGTATNALAVGADSYVDIGAAYSSALGGAYTNASYAIAIGFGSSAEGLNSIVIGRASDAADQDSIALGYACNPNYPSTLALSMTGQTDNKHHLKTTHLFGITTDAVATPIYGSGATTGVPVFINTQYFFEGTVLGSRTSTGAQTGLYKFEGVVKNVLGGTSFVVTPTVTAVHEDNAAWNVTVTVNDTNDTLVVTVTGAGTDTIHWSCKLDWMELPIAAAI